MEAKDLMIDDWVIYRGEPTIVYEIDDYYQRINTEPDGYDSIKCIEISEIKPIPLTSEILEKNGFVANKHVYPYPYYEYINEEGKLKVGFAFPQGNRTSYKEPWIYVDSEYVFVEHLPCIYVHQLQHILRLCEIEKEIIL